MEKYSDAYLNFVDTFLKSICVDDVSYGANSVDQAYELYFQSKHILAEAVLAQWIEHESASV